MASTQVIKENQKVTTLAISRSLEVASGNMIWEGTLVGMDANGKAIVADTTHRISGMAINSKAGGWVVTVNYNHVVRLNFPAVTAADIGKTVYAVDNDTVSLTQNTAVAGQIVTIESGKVYVHLTLCCMTTGGGLVDSVFSRTGDVKAVASDYNASQIANNSAYVAGTFASDALDRLHNYETRIVKTANYTVQVGDNIIGVDTTAGDVTITLMSASGIAGLHVRVCKQSSDSNKVIIVPAGGETIVGQSSWELCDPGNAVMMVASGTNYWCIYADRKSTETIYFPVEPDANLGNHRVQNIAATGSHRFEFHVPHDFLSLVKANMVASPASGAAGAGKDIDLYSDYATTGELYNAHTESDTTTVYNTGTTNTLFELDISSVLSSLSGGDTCGVLVDHKSIGGTVSYYAIEFKYVRKN